MCRSRRELSNEYLLAKFGFDTAENEPLKVRITDHTFDHIPSVLYAIPIFFSNTAENGPFRVRKLSSREVKLRVDPRHHRMLRLAISNSQGGSRSAGRLP